MAELFRTGERGIVESLIRKFDAEGAGMLGDDCAIFDMGEDFFLMTTDMITRDTHIPENARPEDIGWYAAAINLSDIAAMGGVPLGMVFALGLPRGTEMEWLGGLADGMQECCASHGVPILGGDTKESQSLTIAGTAVGRVEKSRILRRSGARPGDIVAMTGSLGRGLLWERDRTDASKLLRIQPRLKIGRALAESGAVTSCIDMSDGLSTSLHHLSEAGKIGFEIDEKSLPVLPGLNDLERKRALHWGGEFELLFTFDPAKAGKLPMDDVTRIGRVTEGLSIILMTKTGSESLPNAGYEHFGVSQ